MAVDPGILRAGSAWTAAQIERFLHESRIPVRLGCLTGNGVPLVCSLWYLYDDAAIWCATVRDAHVAEILAARPSCAFEVAGDLMPYRGVRGQGRATIVAEMGPAVLERLVDRYLGTRDSKFAQWLLARVADEVAIRIEPDWLTAWDFSRRMTAQ